MIEVKVNKDIKQYSEQIVMGFDLRQSICIGIALIVGAGIFLLVNFSSIKINYILLSYISMIICAPVLAFGFIKYQGMTFEKFLFTYIDYKFLTPHKMPYIPKNTYYELIIESRKQQKREDKKNKSLFVKLLNWKRRKNDE